MPPRAAQADPLPPIKPSLIGKVYAKEGALRDDVRDWLRQLPHAKAIKLHGSEFQERGLPDFLLVWHGLAVAIELKREGGELTTLQTIRMTEFRAAGAATLSGVTSVEDLRDRLARFAGDHLSQFGDFR